jgi:hypothetical protein
MKNKHISFIIHTRRNESSLTFCLIHLKIEILRVIDKLLISITQILESHGHDKNKIVAYFCIRNEVSFSHTPPVVKGTPV